MVHPAGPLHLVADLLVETALAPDRHTAANLIKLGRVSVNMHPVLLPEDALETKHLILGHTILRVEVPRQPARWAQVRCCDVPLDDRFPELEERLG